MATTNNMWKSITDSASSLTNTLLAAGNALTTTTNSLLTIGNTANESLSNLLRNFKVLSASLGRFSFNASSALRVDSSGSSVGTVTTVTTVATVTTMTTGNIGLGDMGKSATAQLVTQQNFNLGMRRNLVII